MGREKTNYAPGPPNTRAVAFPADYGFIPDTRAVDRDAIDAIVFLEEPTFPGIWVKARPIGVCWVQDGADREPKILCVPVDDPSYENIRDVEQLPSHLLGEVSHFFDIYKRVPASPRFPNRRIRGTRRCTESDQGR